MAGKKAEIICLDVGSAMLKQEDEVTHLNMSIRATSLWLQRKLQTFKKQDLTGLVLFGSQETNNELADGEQYQNVQVMHELDKMNLDMLETVENGIVPGDQPGDFLDALLVAYMMITKKCKKLKYNKSIIIVTNGESEVSDTEQVQEIIAQLKEEDIHVKILGIDLDIDEDDDDSDNENSGDKLNTDNYTGPASGLILKQLADETDGDMFSLHDAIEDLTKFKKGDVRQVALFRGSLSFGSNFNIPVNAFAMTKQASFPTLETVSKVEGDGDDGDGEVRYPKVNMQRTYHLLDEDQTEVSQKNEDGEDSGDMVKAFKYGVDRIPVQSCSGGLESERGLEILCFAEPIPRRYWMGETIAIVPAPGCEPAQVAFVSFGKALLVAEKVAIVRYVSAAKRAPKIGFISAEKVVVEKETKEEVLVRLMFTALPFADDVRNFVFAPLDRKKYQPTLEQNTAVRNLIEKMDLMKTYKTEDGTYKQGLNPKNTFNPAIQYFWQCVHHRAMNPEDANLPEHNPIITSYLEANQKVKDDVQEDLAKIQNCFKLRKIEKRSKTQDASAYFKDENEELDEDSLFSNKRAKTDDEGTIAGISSQFVKEVGSINPIENFRAMCARRDTDMVEEAIKQMGNQIESFVENSMMDELYDKAFGCLVVLRETSVKDDEYKSFNIWLQKYKDKVKNNKRLQSFWQRLVDKKITLISSEEAVDSDITKDAAEEFLQGNSLIPEREPSPEPEADEEDLLMDL